MGEGSDQPIVLRYTNMHASDLRWRSCGSTKKGRATFECCWIEAPSADHGPRREAQGELPGIVEFAYGSLDEGPKAGRIVMVRHGTYRLQPFELGMLKRISKGHRLQA